MTLECVASIVLMYVDIAINPIAATLTELAEMDVKLVIRVVCAKIVRIFQKYLGIKYRVKSKNTISFVFLCIKIFWVHLFVLIVERDNLFLFMPNHSPESISQCRLKNAFAWSSSLSIHLCRRHQHCSLSNVDDVIRINCLNCFRQYNSFYIDIIDTVRIL